MILETLSHQNFADLKLGYEPEFKFTVARSVYKSILKYLAEMHHSNYTVQPLPVSHFAVTEGKKKNTFELRWIPTEDPLTNSKSSGICGLYAYRIWWIRQRNIRS